MSVGADDMSSDASFTQAIDWAEANSIVSRTVEDVAGKGRNLFGVHSLEDLRQEGLEAFFRASRTFDESYKVPFPRYARQAVAYALLRYLRANDPLPERTRRDLRKIRVAESAFLHEGIENPSTVQISRATGLSLQRVLRVRRESYEVSQFAQQPQHEGLDYPGLTGDTPEDRYLLWESRERIHAVIRSFTSRQREVFQLRFVEGKTVSETAQALGLTKGRVSQVSSGVEAALRGALQAEK